MSSIGQKIRQARQGKGMTVAKLAEAIGVTDRAVRHWEADLREPMFASVAAVAKATGYPLDHFIDEEDTGEAAADKAVHR